ncbi:hypothetical protein AV530_010891 [Patagioenas fasciata monilis]|uniref:Uncharacterized protein n=1 Tax=Patagioenas fasciata monilis TaxID=372326 RepID=A0A1V4K836_PATFA|nr:hypothetical protein AV530_010891 [Patagioenas fasciata monilis]
MGKGLGLWVAVNIWIHHFASKLLFTDVLLQQWTLWSPPEHTVHVDGRPYITFPSLLKEIRKGKDSSHTEQIQL